MLHKEDIMALDKLEVRVSMEKLIIVLAVILIPLNFLGLFLAVKSQTAAERTIGALFSSIAQNNAAAARLYIDDRVVEVATIASQLTIVDAVAAAKGPAAHVADETKAAKIADIEKKWNTPEADSLIAGILSSRASLALRHHRELDPRMLKLIVVDENGVPVGATDKPTHYAPVDEVFWQAVSANGKGGIYVSGVNYDEQSKVNYVVVGVPVLDASSQRFVGAVRALVDVSTLFARLNRELPPTMLVTDDGTVVSAANVTPSMQMKSDEYKAVRDALGTLHGRQAGYVLDNTREGIRIVGFADTGLKPSFSNLGWFVLVSQNERDVLSPIRTVGYFAIFMGIFGLLMVTLLATYFFLHRKQEMADIEAPNNHTTESEHNHNLAGR
jgi:hypothetical protein